MIDSAELQGDCQLSVIIPVLNEAALVEKQIAHVRAVAPFAEIIVVDGGSHDNTVTLATKADIVLHSLQGRSAQMNVGAEHACGRYLLMLHVDTVLPPEFKTAFECWVTTSPLWGYFNLRLSGGAFLLRVVERLINLRTEITGGATGDQCQLFRADFFHALKGFPCLPLMEDLAMSRRCRRLAFPKVVSGYVLSSSRRWEKRGIVRTVLLMWLFRALFLFGVSPRRFAHYYGVVTSEKNNCSLSSGQ